MTKHTYTEAEKPTNTGSITRPGRLNLRLGCSARARTHKVFQRIRKMTGLPDNEPYADVWEKRILPALEHIVWNADNAPRSTKNFVMELFRPLPTEDYVRSQYERLKARFERHEATPPSQMQMDL